MNIEIKTDLFNISNRLKSIDKKYFVVFNTQKNCYEIHYRRAKNTYELTVPFGTLDARTVQFVQKTKIENSKQIYEEIEKANQKAVEANQKKTLEQTYRSIYES
jgi:hypothetical protein